MTIEIEKLTLGEIREIAKLASCGKAKPAKSHSLEIGKAYFIRTVTMHYTGRVRAITATDIVLDDVAWIADSGRFHAALLTGTLNEVEPMPDGTIVSRGAFVDAAPWTHPLPKAAK